MWCARGQARWVRGRLLRAQLRSWSRPSLSKVTVSGRVVPRISASTCSWLGAPERPRILLAMLSLTAFHDMSRRLNLGLKGGKLGYKSGQGD